ncbi:MAG: bifunctional adenosylcobinamide kinase/adenosylcobinamide-phosphate guanylyltransferase, partial [Actinobacteria bacterium]|nr:bifunctional adenosylcobinamide kinase/adenosylcobinamide-phosphate guanylyltransferase [Actinomycetota bacterium]
FPAASGSLRQYTRKFLVNLPFSNNKRDKKTMAKIYLLLGGARSGKSEYSEKLAASLSYKVGYLATGQIIDEEMKKRIELHKKRRPDNWKTFEIEKSDIDANDFQTTIRKIIDAGIDVLILDCVTNLVFRLIYKYNLDRLEIINNKLEKQIEDGINEFFDIFIKIIKNSTDSNNLNVIAVSNEVGLGLVPPYPFGRIFRDMLGLVNKRLAAIADEVHFFVAGLSIKMK